MKVVRCLVGVLLSLVLLCGIIIMTKYLLNEGVMLWNDLREWLLVR